MRSFRRLFSSITVVFIGLLLLTGCENKQVIINSVPEREANEIVVFLASRGISAEKIPAPASPGATEAASMMWSISVESRDVTEAMSILNQNGLPRQMGTNLLELFAKSGLMSSDKEETIRYQAGLAQQIANTIRKIDGVIDADVQLSFPPAETGIPGQGQPKRVTAAVYVKHQGVLDDPNSHLVAKIKRLVAGSVNGLDINDVTVIPDRSRFTDISLEVTPEALTPQSKEYVKIWSIVMNKQSAGSFRLIFFTLTFAVGILAVVLGWMIWKFYPILRRLGTLKSLIHPAPITVKDLQPAEEEKSTEEGK